MKRTMRWFAHDYYYHYFPFPRSLSFHFHGSWWWSLFFTILHRDRALHPIIIIIILDNSQINHTPPSAIHHSFSRINGSTWLLFFIIKKICLYKNCSRSFVVSIYMETAPNAPMNYTHHCILSTDTWSMKITIILLVFQVFIFGRFESFAEH